MEEYQKEMLDEYRTRKKYSLLPVMGVGGDFVWTGKWFTSVYITEQKYRERFLQFDDGYSYQCYWGEWDYRWQFVKIIKNEKTSY